jgi:hypothetical protein
MTDRELLEMAAKAVGYKVTRVDRVGGAISSALFGNYTISIILVCLSVVFSNISKENQK